MNEDIFSPSLQCKIERGKNPPSAIGAPVNVISLPSHPDRVGDALTEEVGGGEAKLTCMGEKSDVERFFVHLLRGRGGSGESAGFWADCFGEISSSEVGGGRLPPQRRIMDGPMSFER